MDRKLLNGDYFSLLGTKFLKADSLYFYLVGAICTL